MRKLITINGKLNYCLPNKLIFRAHNYHINYLSVFPRTFFSFWSLSFLETNVVLIFCFLQNPSFQVRRPSKFVVLTTKTLILYDPQDRCNYKLEIVI